MGEIGSISTKRHTPNVGCEGSPPIWLSFGKTHFEKTHLGATSSDPPSKDEGDIVDGVGDTVSKVEGRIDALDGVCTSVVQTDGHL